MKSRFALFAALCAVPSLAFAQDTKTAPGMPDAKTKEHDALKTLVGTWDDAVKMAAMPGVPGMDKATETKGVEHAELICNGLYLKSVINGEMMGQPFQGLWLAGYDPFQKTYTSVWVDNNEPGASPATGKFDAKTNTWEWNGMSPHGPMRSVVKINAEGNVETCFAKGPDGKEIQAMEITRTRSKGAGSTSDASATTGGEMSNEQKELAKLVGNWEATMRMQMPDGSWSEEKATEHVSSICGGNWLWSDYDQPNMMGQPFQGHALVGYDSAKKQFVSYWVDTMSPVMMLSTGSMDASGNMTASGTGVDMTGGKMTFKETNTWNGADQRTSKMEFTDSTGTTQHMEIVYKRKK